MLTGPATGGSELTGYELQIWKDGQWVVEASPAKDAISYTDRGLAAGRKYYYRLSAMNSQGASPWSAYVSATTDGLPRTRRC